MISVVFRVDASLEIGTGHVMRCLTLADALRSEGAKIHFICRDHSGHLGPLISAKGYALTLLPLSATSSHSDERARHEHWLGDHWENDAAQTIAVLGKLESVDWLVVDHYGIDARWETTVRRYPGRLLVIDDLADRPHHCDVLLDQNLSAAPTARYQNLVPSSCRQLLGPVYALLHPEYRRTKTRLRVRSGKVRTILVFFGGVDRNNDTVKALAAVDSLRRGELTVNVVVGSGNLHRPAIEQWCLRHPGYHFHCDIPHLADLIADADLAIGAGGVSLWERAVLALPSLVIAVANNQRHVAEQFALSGGCIYLGTSEQTDSEQIRMMLQSILDNQLLALAIGKRAAEFVDGLGAARVLKFLLKRQVSLRLACGQDCGDVYRWRNHEVTRRYSGSNELISWETHKQWFKKVLAEPKQVLLIAEHHSRAVGVLRFDFEEDEAMISVYLVPEECGKGFGKATIEAGMEYLAREVPQVNHVVARISAQNWRSRAVFEKVGFQKDTLLYRKVVRASDEN